MSKPRSQLIPARPQGRSRVSNQKEILPGVDGRSLVARRYKDLVAQIVVDQGGIERVSETRLQLVRRFAALAVLAEQQEARIANGEQIDLAEFSQLTSTMVRVSTRLGINRAPKDVTPPSPIDYARRER